MQKPGENVLKEPQLQTRYSRLDVFFLVNGWIDFLWNLKREERDVIWMLYSGKYRVL